MGNFVTDMLLYNQEGVDFAFCNDGGIRCDFAAKDLTTYDIYTVSPFNNLMYKVKMTGAQIVKLLEQVVGNDSSNLQMAGLTAKYDLKRAEDDQIFDVRKADGTPIDINETYTVLVNEYIATGGNKYSVFVTDVLSSYNTNELDNETIIAAVKDLGQKGDLKLDTSPRLVAATMEVPTTTKETSIYVDNSFKLVYDNLLGTADVTYKSDNKKVASVSKSGVVTGKKSGTVNITTTIKQGNETYTLVTKVTVKVPSIKFSASVSKLSTGKAFTFKVKKSGLDGKVIWKSSNTKVATVNKNGKVTAKKPGKTVISATIGKYTVKKTVTVK